MDLTLVDSEITSASYEVKEGETLNLSLASFAAFPEVEINVNVASNGKFCGAFADFSKGSGTIRVSVHLQGEGAEGSFHSAVVCDGASRKTFDTSLYHDVPHTEGLMSNYGIAMGSSRLNFSGTSEIKKGSFGSSTRQESKIIVFDEGCLGRCMPVLNIDENDVTASHAAVVGKLNEDHLFYLRSRGISLEAAKRLITLGYLKPIETYFRDQSLLDRIDEAIEGGV